MINPVPWLRRGTGNTPEQGGCIMQVVDWIDREMWTDSPPCVHPTICEWAIEANDTSDDATRQKLLDLAPRLMGTSLNRTAELDEALDELECDCGGCVSKTCSFDTLVKMLDEYDRITGRTRQQEALDYAAVCAVMQP